MRAILIAGLVLLTADPVLAQSRDSIDSLNATNERLSERSEIRGVEQQQQFRNNETRMDIERSDLFRPTPAPSVIVEPGRR